LVNPLNHGNRRTSDIMNNPVQHINISKSRVLVATIEIEDQSNHRPTGITHIRQIDNDLIADLNPHPAS